jgi:hypothetical protein
VAGPQWRKIESTWLVTNRHVVLPRLRVNLDGQIIFEEILPSALTFNLRRIEGQSLRWEPISINQETIRNRTKCHPNPNVDVCAIEVDAMLTEYLQAGVKNGVQYVPWGGISKEMFPGGGNKLSVEASDSVIVVGYPKGYYDTLNLFPLLKGGLIASRWGANFRGMPCFLIDGQMFPGSSGSLVVSRPTNFTVENGQIFSSPDKQFAVLGILSGESWNPEQDREFEISSGLTLQVKGVVNTGLVWYGTTIEEILSGGAPPNPIGRLH